MLPSAQSTPRHRQLFVPDRQFQRNVALPFQALHALPSRSATVACGLMLFASLVSSAVAQTSYPMLMSISPVAAATGQTSEHTFRSRYSMAGAYQVIVSGDGVRGEVVADAVTQDANAKVDDKKKSASTETIKVKFMVNKDAVPGVRDVRVATPTGVSTVGQLVIVSDPVVVESDGNETQATAQSIALPATLCGRIEKAEDVDFYRFNVPNAMDVNFHVQCMRLEDRIHDLQTHADPILFLRDANGSVIASADNTFSADPLVSARLEKGDYFLELRDVRYQGNTYWEYSIEVNSRPVITCAYPLAVPVAQSSSVELLGLGLTGSLNSKVAPSDLSASGLRRIPLTTVDSQRQFVSLVGTDQPLVMEQPADNDDPGQAQPCPLGTIINGRIEKEGDVDCYQFEAKKDQRFSFEVFARRAGSPLDSHLRLLDAKGNPLQLSDDMRLGKRNYSDSWIENWTVPVDGKYTLEIRDLHLRGGAAFVYCLKMTDSTPHFLLYTDTDKTPIASGTSGVLYVRAERKNGFEGPIQLHVHDLPPGVTAHAGRILPGKATDGCIVFEAPTTMPPQVAPISVTGTATVTDVQGQSRDVHAVATVYQEIYQPGGGRGHWPVDRHVLAVAAPADLRAVRVSQNAITLKPGQSTAIDVELVRAEGFDKNVTLEVTYMHLAQVFGSSLPEGVTVDSSASNTLLTSGATKGKIVLKAAANAPAVDRQQIVVMANVSLNFVMKATYGSQPITLTVSPPET